MSRRRLSPVAAELLERAALAYPEWIRAERAGERPSLSSLESKGLLERRVWREARHPADRAHEYRATPAVCRAIARVRARLEVES